jgi:4-oxalocrotonate tautomerase
MPHIIVKLYPGRSEEQKINLVKDVTTAVSKNLNLDESTISVAIEEVPKEKWAKEVYKKDIIDNHKKLYKEPGYRTVDSEFE